MTLSVLMPYTPVGWMEEMNTKNWSEIVARMRLKSRKMKITCGVPAVSHNCTWFIISTWPTQIYKRTVSSLALEQQNWSGRQHWKSSAEAASALEALLSALETEYWDYNQHWISSAEDVLTNVPHWVLKPPTQGAVNMVHYSFTSYVTPSSNV